LPVKTGDSIIKIDKVVGSQRASSGWRIPADTKMAIRLELEQKSFYSYTFSPALAGGMVEGLESRSIDSAVLFQESIAPQHRILWFVLKEKSGNESMRWQRPVQW
jgi:hypothetical protein